MSSSSIFDILGPVMIGPSSSHTAGALRLGKAARIICGAEFDAATFYLHGSFAKTYRGHGTDRALAAGILGMGTEDERIINALDIAKEEGISIDFVEADMGDVHPNTVKICLTKKDGHIVTVTGSSIGGGNITITNIDGDAVSFDGKYPVIVVKHFDKPGMISQITSVIAAQSINIATLRVGRIAKGDIATTVVETDQPIPQNAVAEIERIENVIAVRVVNMA